MAVAAIIWALVLVLYALKWMFAREQAVEEASHPVQCCFIGLAGVATMLIGAAAIPYSMSIAVVLFGAGAAFTLDFAVWRTGLILRGGRDPATTTPVLYLPTVAGGFVMGIGASSLGYLENSTLAGPTARRASASLQENEDLNSEVEGGRIPEKKATRGCL